MNPSIHSSLSSLMARYLLHSQHENNDARFPATQIYICHFISPIGNDATGFASPGSSRRLQLPCAPITTKNTMTIMNGTVMKIRPIARTTQKTIGKLLNFPSSSPDDQQAYRGWRHEHSDSQLKIEIK